jgi:hypothetical protein
MLVRVNPHLPQKVFTKVPIEGFANGFERANGIRAQIDEMAN